MGNYREVLICRTCNAEKIRDWRAKNLDRAREQRRASDARRLEKRRLYDRRQFDKPEFKARRWLNRKIVTGHIIKPEVCDVCGSPTESRELYGRHINAERLGEVIWLCPGCRTTTKDVVNWGNDPRPRQEMLDLLLQGKS